VKRHFASGAGIAGETVRVAGRDAPFGTDLLFHAEDLPGLVVGVEICEDLWVPEPPGMRAALAGATVLANLSGSPITVGRAESRALLSRA
ncbi:NAD(+) synthase, partial [Escherichia coli]|nr:NAD(+) synthase [Escherichia coli]